MNVLLISESIKCDKNCDSIKESLGLSELKLETISWVKIDSFKGLEDYHIVIIDLFFDGISIERNQEIYDKLLATLRYYIQKGVTAIILCGEQDKYLYGYIPNSEQDIDDQRLEPEEVKIKTYSIINDVTNGVCKDIGINNSNYGSNIIGPTSKRSLKKYFENVDCYNVFFDLSSVDKDDKETYAYTGGASESPIAASLKVDRGYLLLLPGYDINKKEKVLLPLLEMSKDYFFIFQNNKSQENTENRPVWISDCYLDEYHTNEQKINKLREKQEKFERIASILYQTGDEGDENLEKSVLETLSYFFCDIIRTAKDKHIDIEASYETMKFAFEVTGTTGKVHHKTSKVNQILSYRTEEDSKDTKIVLIANTFRNLNIQQNRLKQEHFTDHSSNLLTVNEVCFFTTFDLYQLWKGCYEGVFDKNKVIKLIFDTNGRLNAEEPSTKFYLKKEA